MKKTAIIEPLLFAAVSGQVIDTTGNPWGYALVQFSLFVPSGQIPVDLTTGLVIPTPAPIICDGSGNFTASLQTNSTVVPDSLWQLTVFPFNNRINGQKLQPFKVLGALTLTPMIEAELKPHVDSPLILPMSNNGTAGQSTLNGSIFFDVEAQELALMNPATGSYISIPTLNTPPIFTEPVQAPWFIATGTVPAGDWPQPSLLVDFQPSTNSGRFMAKSNDANLATIQIAASSSTADGRFLIYLYIDEPTGAGSAFATFNVPLLLNDGGLTVLGEPVLEPATTSYVQHGVTSGSLPFSSMNCALAPTNSKISQIYTDASGGLNFLLLSDDGTQSAPWMQIERNGVTPTAVTFFCDLNVTGGTKNFVIPHPLDNNKTLTHACLEGPESAVYYRGEARTQAGIATIMLPDYFEALTRLEGRTVLLTELFEEDSEAVIGQNRFSALMASRVSGGKFSVRSNFPFVRFYWEVKAVRADVPMLQVVTSKE